MGFFLRGDAQCDGDVDMFDAIYIANWLGGMAVEPLCLDACDVDDDGDVDMFDYLSLFRWLGGTGTQPPEPYLDFGVDPTEDGLGCDCYPPCDGGCS